MEGKEEKLEDIGIEVPSGVEGMLGYKYLIRDSEGPIDHIPVRIDLDKAGRGGGLRVDNIVDTICRHLEEVKDKSLLFEEYRLCIFIKLTDPTILDIIEIEVLISQILSLTEFPILIFDTLTTESFATLKSELTLYNRDFAVLDSASGSPIQRQRVFNLLDMEDCCSIYLMRPPFVN